jgi:hypothetical protein
MKCGGRWSRDQWKEITRSVPVRPKAEVYPDFAARRKEIFGNKKVKQTGTELVAEFRGDY